MKANRESCGASEDWPMSHKLAHDLVNLAIVFSGRPRMFAAASGTMAAAILYYNDI